ncbi:MAG: hypothetical protein V7776_23895, partial [Halopseudomonas aestusnigri]
TEAALHLCDNLPKKLKKHYVQKGVGHYGIFNGSKYREGVAPKIKDWINKHHEQAALTATSRSLNEQPVKRTTMSNRQQPKRPTIVGLFYSYLLIHTHLLTIVNLTGLLLH